jgi:hypothetical protein
LLLLRSFLSSDSSIHHLQSRISRSQTNKLRSESLDFSLPLMKPRRIYFTKKYLKPNSLQSQRQLTSFSGPPISDAGDGSSLKLPHLMALRHYKSNSFAGNVIGHSCFSSSFGRQTLTLILKALLVSGPRGFSRVSRGYIFISYLMNYI